MPAADRKSGLLLQACAEGGAPRPPGGLNVRLVPDLGRVVEAGCGWSWRLTDTVWFGRGKLVLLSAVSPGSRTGAHLVMVPE